MGIPNPVSFTEARIVILPFSIFFFEILRTISDDYGWVFTMKYGRERESDAIQVYQEGTQENSFDIVEGVNLIDISGEKYTPKDMKNSISKLYDIDSTHMGLVQDMDVDSVGRYCIYDSYAKLQDATRYYAEFLANQEMDAKKGIAWAYTATLAEVPKKVVIGGFVNCFVDEPKYAGVKIIKSCSVKYSRDQAPELQISVDLEKPAMKYRDAVRKINRRVHELEKGTVQNVFKDVDPNYSTYIMDGWSIQTS